MTDQRLRELERRARETGSVEDEAAYLVARVRAGDLTEAALLEDAIAGAAAAARALGESFAHMDRSEVRRMQRAWTSAFARRGHTVYGRDWRNLVLYASLSWPKAEGVSVVRDVSAEESFVAAECDEIVVLPTDFVADGFMLREAAFRPALCRLDAGQVCAFAPDFSWTFVSRSREGFGSYFAVRVTE